MSRIAVLGGTGDAYLVCALVAGSDKLKRAQIAIKSRQSAIPAMFGLNWDASDAEIEHVESDKQKHLDYDNRLFQGRTLYAHPCFTRGEARLDDLTVLDHPPSQADMYRVILGLPIDSPLAQPKIPITTPRSGSAVLITEAVSWPNDQPLFWHGLQNALRAGGWSVKVNERSVPLEDLLTLAAGAEMVVGPQCGLMALLVAGQFPCRKVLATPTIDGGPGFQVGTRWMRKTYPYAYVNKFDGNDYDVEEYRITEYNHREIIAEILAAPRTPRDPRPVASITMPLTPGDFLDRLAVLSVKKMRGVRGVDRELRRYVEMLPTLPRGLNDEFAELLELHGVAFSLLENIVPAALNGGTAPGEHDAVVKINRTRVMLKNAIDAACRAPYREAKSYYAPEDH